MRISGIGQYDELYRQRNLPEIRQVSVEEVRRQEERPDQQAAANPEQELQPDHRSRMADLENISLTFHESTSDEYLGRDAGLENLDVMSAISDMQKDKLLQQYQYFVGPQDIHNQVIAFNDDGIVIQK